MAWKIKGQKELSGIIPVSGSKNAVLPIIAASILAKDKVTLRNVPDLSDVSYMTLILNELNVHTDYDEKTKVLEIDATNLKNNATSENFASKLRASFLVSGSLLGLFGKVQYPMPGGCSIGQRPIDLHLKAFKQLGAEHSIRRGHVLIEGDLKANSIFLDFPSVGATENALLTAVSVQGKTTILNAAEEPEIFELVRFLKEMGADIYKEEGKSWVVNGGKELKGVDFKVCSDRIEAGTWLTLSALTNGAVKVSKVEEDSIHNILVKFGEAGYNINKEYINDEMIYSLTKKEAKSQQRISLQTGPHPSYPTDMQPLMTVLASLTDGMHVVVDTVFSNRFQYAHELLKMGAKIEVLDSRMGIINGVDGLQSSIVTATDLRAGAALVLAGLVAEGETVVTDTDHILRGYEDILKKLENINAEISVVNN